MFLEMFGASALATILFGNKSSTSLDYKNYFDTLNRKFDTLNTKIDTIHDKVEFMKARMCLEHFSVKLFNNIQLTLKYYKVEDIMAAATEGFEKLCNIALIDDDDFKEARNKFKETFGNYDWVKAQYKDKIAAIENYTTFTKDEIAHYSKIFETIQTIKKLIKAKTELDNELCKTSVLRFQKRKKLRAQIQNIDNELKAHYRISDSSQTHTYYGSKCKKYAYFLLNTAGYVNKITKSEKRSLNDLMKSPYL